LVYINIRLRKTLTSEGEKNMTKTYEAKFKRTLLHKKDQTVTDKAVAIIYKHYNNILGSCFHVVIGWEYSSNRHILSEEFTTFDEAATWVNKNTI
jgi:hypothetical protein